MQTIGRYRVLRPLGHGGMGDVFLAHDPTLERDVALKLLHRQSTRTGLRDEAKALAALSHPGIVTIFEIGEHDGQDFIAMEYLPGRSLREVIAAGAQRNQLIAICIKVAHAISAAHRAGILHRDIKPENVVVTEAGDVKVVDFGIARRLEHTEPRVTSRVTALQVVETLRRTLPPEASLAGTDTEISAGTQTMFGTPAYMAPEVLLGEGSTPESDIFSFGVVLYECLAGRRPYDATTLVEVIAHTISGPPPRLGDRLGELVERMLASEPKARPTIDQIVRSLSRAPTQPAVPVPFRLRWPIVAIAAVMTGAVAGGAYWLASGSDAPGATVPAATAPINVSMAVAPFSIEMPSYGREPPSAGAIADVLSRLLGEVQGARVVGMTADGNDVSAARSLDARYLVTGTIKEQGAVLRAELAITEIATGKQVTVVRAERPSPQLAPLLAVISGNLVHAVAPDADIRVDTAPNRLRAQTFYREGAPILEAGHFTDARTYFEQAVHADPALFDGWYSLALVLGWMEAADPLVRAATAKAVELAPPGPKQELVRGISLYLSGNFRGSREALEPLEKITGAGAPDPRELGYYLGEANWHDGRHDDGFRYFKSLLDRYPRFRPATVHAWQYAVARRDGELARYYVGLAGESTEWIDSSLGHYEQLAKTGSASAKLSAQLVLGVTSSPEIEAKLRDDNLEAATLRIAFAAGAGDLATARGEFAKTWAKVRANTDPNQVPGIIYGLEGLGEVALAAGLTDESKLVIGFLAEHSKEHPARNYQRFAILAAPLAGDPKLIIEGARTERMDKLAAASAAELARDHAGAAQILDEVIKNPTFAWDYPERAALIRNLRSIRSKQRLKAVCADTLRPAVVRPALLAVRRACR